MYRLLHFLFRFEYVVLVLFNGERMIRRVYKIGNTLYAHPYLPHTRCQILPGGKVVGKIYIDGWEPITPKTIRLWEKKAA